IELAYKKKCIQLKKRLNEIESENDIMRARNKRAKGYVQKMRLETCIMLERLATLTGMFEEQQPNTTAGNGGVVGSAELRAKAAAIMGEKRKAGTVMGEALDDETEGSSEERPPTPQERPLRVKRSRRSNMPIDELEAEMATQLEADKSSPNHNSNNNNTSSNNHADENNASLPALAPAPSQEQLTSSFRVVNNNGDSNTYTNSGHGSPVPMDVEPKEES
ncbi:hypothetical protein BGW36DRAFT_368113, partial [Talaromyces proteolyticus]